MVVVDRAGKQNIAEAFYKTITMGRWLWLGAALLVLALVYIFQQVSYAHGFNAFLPGYMQVNHPYAVFVVNKTVRLVLNDLACMAMIYAIFRERKYMQVAFMLFLTEVFLILPLYFFFKLGLEGASEISSPLLSQVHRLIVNPLLMFLLMIGFVFQRVGKA